MAVAKANSVVLLGVLVFIQSGLGVAAIKMLDMHKSGDRVMKLNKSCDGSGLSSRVVLPSDTDYDSSRSQFASVMASSVTADARLRPKMILFCTNASQVQEAVQFASTCGFKISVRSGGHNYAAASSCTEDAPNCIQVDLSGIDTFVVDTVSVPNRVTLGVGLTLTQVFSQLAAYGLTVPGGVCQTVGVGGHYQSSAHGYLAKALGLGIDVMLSARMVLADGQVHTVDETSDPELFWALRGGGPGSWGIALEYTLETFANADYPYVKTFTFMYPYSRAALLLLGSMFSDLSMEPEAERDMTYAIVIHPGVLLGVPGSTNEHYIMIRAVWIGIDNGELTGALYDKFVQPWDDIPHATYGPIMSVPLSHLQGGLAASWELGPYRYSVHAFAMRSYPGADFYDKVADELDARVAIPNFQFSWQIWGWGGAFQGSQTNRNAGINAYTVRDALAWVDDWVFFLTDDLAEVAEERIHAFREATGHHWQEDNIPHSWMTPDTLINNTYSSAVDFTMNESWFARLQTTKNRIDPADLFHASMTIPISGSAFPAAAASAVGDPHLQNIHGQRFDLMRTGWHTLLEIPRQAAAQRVLLLVEAETYHEGSACADMYFQSLNITGEWAQEKQKGGLHFSARDSDGTGSAWMSFGGVDVKVKRGRTLQGTHYLNLFVKHLAKTGYAIGGLLGEDDHTMAATPESSCQRRLSLIETQAPSERAVSSAEASLE